MGVTASSPRKLDPEGIATKVIVRLIEELSCVSITPDSPVWQDIVAQGRRVGELRVYRGRGRVQKIVTCSFSVGSPAVNAQSVIVLTEPSSPVPHLVLDSMHVGPKVSFHLDLLPKRDLAVSLAYLDRCYVPLSEVRGDLDADERFSAAQLSRRLRSLLSPWNVAHAVDVADLSAAQAYVDRYVTHWASLLRSNASDFESAPDIASRDVQHRQLLFRRGVDPLWDMLDRMIDREAVDLLIAALSS